MTSDTPKKSRLELAEEAVVVVKAELEDMKKRMDALEAAIATGAGKSKGKFGGKGKQGGQPMKDTKTGKLYASKSELGKDLCAEVNEPPENTFVYYKLEKAFPERFVECNDEEKKTVADRVEKDRKEREEAMQREIDEQARKTAEEEAAGGKQQPAAEVNKNTGGQQSGKNKNKNK